MEQWKDIEGYEGLYQVSDQGRVKSLKFGKEHIMKPQNNGYGYLQIPLRKEGKLIRYAIHRLVALAFIPNNENKKEVNHIDGNKTNNHVDNLEWCTRQENVDHVYNTGLRKRFDPKTPISKIPVMSLIHEFTLRDLREQMKESYLN